MAPELVTDSPLDLVDHQTIALTAPNGRKVRPVGLVRTEATLQLCLDTLKG